MYICISIYGVGGLINSIEAPELRPGGGHVLRHRGASHDRRYAGSGGAGTTIRKTCARSFQQALLKEYALNNKLES